MEFQSKIFVKVSNPGARLVDLSGPLFMGSLVLVAVLELFKVPDPLNYGTGVFALSFLCAIVGRIIAKGNMFKIGLSDTELVVAEDGVRVGEKYYAQDQLTDLDFLIGGFDGMRTATTGTVGRFRATWGKRLSGADNKIHFRVDGKKHLYQFYLPDQGSMSQLGQVFRTYYERRILFYERNQVGRTFLFRQVHSKNQLEDMKRGEGFA